MYAVIARYFDSSGYRYTENLSARTHTDLMELLRRYSCCDAPFPITVTFSIDIPPNMNR